MRDAFVADCNRLDLDGMLEVDLDHTGLPLQQVTWTHATLLA